MLIWTPSTAHGRTSHNSVVVETSDTIVRESVEACAETAINMLNDNIQDDSLYLIFEWNLIEAELVISVTDSTKTKDAPHSHRCVFSGVAKGLKTENQQDYADQVKFWLHDYLSTYAPFFQYSLVAIFHSSTRSQTELL